MTLYAESSAVLTWLLGEPNAPEVGSCLAAAATIVTSDLTMVECDRVLTRATALGDLAEADAAAQRADLGRSAARWTLLRVGRDVLDRARQRFPAEPVRTLDAVHLASALAARAAVADTQVLSLDESIRKNARALGFGVRP